MTARFRRIVFRFALSHGLLCGLAGLAIPSLLVAQERQQTVPQTDREEGIPVTDPLVIAKCGSCHARDERGNMQRISWERTTPESWQEVLKQMILLNNLSVTPAEARSIVKYLSSLHGLALEKPSL